jgi:hypothetical protein
MLLLIMMKIIGSDLGYKLDLNVMISGFKGPQNMLYT